MTSLEWMPEEQRPQYGRRVRRNRDRGVMLRSPAAKTTRAIRHVGTHVMYLFSVAYSQVLFTCVTLEQGIIFISTNALHMESIVVM